MQAQQRDQQREEDAQLTKMMLRDYEEKFKRLKLLADGIVSADKYLIVWFKSVL